MIGMWKTKLLFFNLFIYFTGFQAAAYFEKNLYKLDMQDGLIDNTVLSICKDRTGFIWFGTTTGLSRYDGIQFKNYPLQSENSGIQVIYEMPGNKLGLISHNVFLCFDKESERYLPVTASYGNVFYTKQLIPANDSVWWSLGNKRLQRIRQRNECDETGRIVSIRMQVEKDYSSFPAEAGHLSAFCFSPDSSLLYLISCNQRLFIFDTKRECVTETVRLEYDGTYIDPVSAFISEGYLWITSIKKGITRYRLDSHQVENYMYEKGTLSHSDVYALIRTDQSAYLAATWNGYTVLKPDKKTGKLTTEIYNESSSSVFRDFETRMLSACYDPKGILYIGTHGSGVLVSDLRNQFYKQYRQKTHNEICGILTDRENRIWLATYFGGLLRSNMPFQTDAPLEFSPVGQEKTVLCAAKDQEDNLWFGNEDGTLTCYPVRTGKLTSVSLRLPDGSFNKEKVWALHAGSNRRFFVGTQNGLLLLDCNSGICKPVRLPAGENGLLVRAVTEDRQQHIWLGTNAGVYRLSFTGDEIQIKTGYEQAAHLKNTEVRSLLTASDGLVYVGYANGLGVLSPEKDDFIKFYSHRDGLSSNFIACIQEDAASDIWLGTNSGLTWFSKRLNLFYNYYISVSNRSVMRFGKTLFWGNYKRLTYFDPEEILAFPADGRVMITGLEVNGKEVETGKPVNKQTILSRNIAYTDAIELSHKNRDFSLTFNNLSYSRQQQKYSYRLFPYQQDWLVSNGNEKVSYTNLSQGEYVFQVKSISPDGTDGETTALQVKIRPPWTQTIWFRLMLLLLSAGGIYYLIRRIRLRQIKREQEMQLRHELQLAHLERVREKQIRIEREHFFTNTAHELRTPLTLILSPLQELLQKIKVSSPAYGQLARMYKNASSLHTLIDRLLYIQKIEAGMVKLQVSETDITGLVRDVADSFRSMAESTGIVFEVSLPEESYRLWIDAEKIASAVKNLLSNAFKYTSPAGWVRLAVNREEVSGTASCVIRVTDNGSGIPTDKQQSVFESFITGDTIPSFSTRMGIGLRIVKNTMDLHHGRVELESAPGEGSMFALVIPEGRTHFVEDSYEVIACKKETVPETASQSSEEEERYAGSAAKYTLLIIEDNEDMRRYIGSLFRKTYHVLEAADGDSGVRLSREKIPDLIISDVMMPGKDGFTCCREIREHPETAHIPVIMLTAKAEDIDILKGSRTGADDYMMKPFNPEILKAKVENIILQRKRLKQIYTKSLMLKYASGTSDEEKLSANESSSAAGPLVSGIPRKDGESDPFMQQVINIIEANLSNESFGAKVLAEMLHVSQPTLYRRIKQRSNLSIAEVIRSVRMSKAAALVLEKKYTVQEVAERVGFTDPNTFRKHFTDMFGVPPSKYADE